MAHAVSLARGDACSSKAFFLVRLSKRMAPETGANLKRPESRRRPLKFVLARDPNALPCPDHGFLAPIVVCLLGRSFNGHNTSCKEHAPSETNNRFSGSFFWRARNMASGIDVVNLEPRRDCSHLDCDSGVSLLLRNTNTKPGSRSAVM